VRDASYAPERGDLVWIDFDLQAGHEQTGRRPALVLSPASYNRRIGLALFCPATRQAKGYPFEVRIPDGLRVGGVLLCDQVRSLDWHARKVEFADRAPVEAVREALRKFSTLLQVG
jgi:mRNA interferase MazF